MPHTDDQMAAVRSAMIDGDIAEVLQAELLTEAKRLLEGAAADIEQFVPLFTEQLLYAQLAQNSEVTDSVLRQMRLLAERRRLAVSAASWDSFARISRIVSSAVVSALVGLLTGPSLSPNQ